MFRIQLLRFVILVLVALIPALKAEAQIGVGDVIVSEFFDDLLRVDSGSVADIFDIARTDNITHLAMANSTTAYVVNFTEIWKIETGSSDAIDFVTVDGNSPSEITMDLSGDLLVSSASHGVRIVNVNTGAISQVYDDTFFNPSDIAVSAEGFIYTTEFFDGLGRIFPGGAWEKLGDWNTNFFQRVDIGPDGYLYCATTFEDGDIYRINPNSGYGSKIADNVFDFIDDLQVASDGTIYLAGNRDTDDDGLTENCVLAIHPITGDVTVVVDENMVGDPSPPFFNPMDIEIFDDTFYFSEDFGTALASTATVSRGTLASGGLNELIISDNSDLVIQRGASDIQSRTELILTATSPKTNPAAIQITVEASVFARSPVTQSISLFNYETNQFEEVDARPARQFIDEVVVVTVDVDPASYVESGTNAMEARIRFQSANQRQQFSSGIDAVNWTIH